jgi:hypothetical protein
MKVENEILQIDEEVLQFSKFFSEMLIPLPPDSSDDAFYYQVAQNIITLITCHALMNGENPEKNLYDFYCSITLRVDYKALSRNLEIIAKNGGEYAFVLEHLEPLFWNNEFLEGLEKPLLLGLEKIPHFNTYQIAPVMQKSPTLH